jgi:hypothetical protein
MAAQDGGGRDVFAVDEDRALEALRLAWATRTTSASSPGGGSLPAATVGAPSTAVPRTR